LYCLFRSAGDGQYMFNLSTKGLSAGFQMTVAQTSQAFRFTPM